MFFTKKKQHTPDHHDLYPLLQSMEDEIEHLSRCFGRLLSVMPKETLAAYEKKYQEDNQ